jgi:hypothetical protein
MGQVRTFRTFTIEKEWTTEAGYRAACLWVKNSHRCGYVEVPKGHPLHGVDVYEEVPALDGETLSDVIRVHGGITYADGDQKYPIPEGGEWWFGFDCNHAWDKSAYSVLDMPGAVERTEEYVVNECEKLARQLKEVES